MSDQEKTDFDRDTYGVLVGWKHSEMGERLDLQLQTKNAAGHLARGEVETFHIVLTRQQAAVLAHYLTQVSGSAPPTRRRGLLARWFG